MQRQFRFTAVAFWVSLAVSACHAQSGLLKAGDSIPDYMTRNPVKFAMPMGDLSQWAEGLNVRLLTYQQGNDSSKPTFLSSRGVPFGVLQGIPPGAYFLFDTDGDGRLDYRTEKVLLPIWLVTRGSKTIDGSSTKVKDLFNILFDAFQSNEGMVLNDRTKPVFAAITQCNRDTLFPNRDIVYQLWYYFTFTERDPSQAVTAMRILERTYAGRFGVVHPIIKLFQVESSLQTEDSSSARAALLELRRMAPDFIPGKYYAFVLEENESTKAAQASQLKKSFPDHWLVMRIDR
jgi:hypothetical protein